MNIAAVSSSGEVSIRTTPSIGSGLPLWTAISASATRDMESVLLYSCDLLFDNLIGRLSVQECREWRDFVCGALDGDHGRTVDGHCAFQGCGECVEVGHCDRRTSGEQARQTSPQLAGSEPVVAVQVVVEQLLAGDTHGVGVVVEQYESHRKPVLHRGVHLHAMHEKCT